MFGILRWWRERGRKIFHFHDGKRSRSVDPIKTWTMLQLDPAFEMDRHVKELRSEDNRTAAEASRVTTSAVRRAFGIAEFEAGGLTDQECIGVFDAYTSWLEAQKKSTS